MPDRIPLSVPHLPPSAHTYLKECLETNFVSSVGPFVAKFEEAFAKAIGARYAVACSSGTAALHVALRLAGVTTDSEVAVPTFTFIASVNAISYNGARPLFVDSEARTWNLDPNQIVDEVEERARRGETLPSAIEVVHILGYPADIEPILRLGQNFEIPVIEDAAEALGASYVEGPLAGRQVGTVGRLGCFSFNGNKVITTGGGGMIVTDDPELADSAQHLTTQARVAGLEYIHDEVGYNYRLTNIAAALGLAQLELLDEYLEKKRAISSRYTERLSGLGLESREHTSWASPSYWLYCGLLPDHAAPIPSLLSKLGDLGIEARPVWSPIHKQKPYAGSRTLGGHIAESIAARAVSLPSSVGLTEEEQERVIVALETILGD